MITVTTKDGKHSASCEVTVFIEQQVIDELITKINDELTALKDKKESDYTPESWKEYKKALEAATNAAKDEKATKADLEKVLENLQAAAAKLQKKAPESETPSTDKKPETPSTDSKNPTVGTEAKVGKRYLSRNKRKEKRQ